MTGEELKGLLRYNKVNVVELAKKFGTSRQNIEGRFKSHAIKTDFLEKIEKAIGKKLVKPASWDDQEMSEEQKMAKMILMMNGKLTKLLDVQTGIFRELREAKMLNKELHKELESLMEEEASISTEESKVI